MDEQIYTEIVEAWRQDLQDMKHGTYRVPYIPPERITHDVPRHTRTLTSQQFKTLNFIKDYTAKHGIAPLYDEISGAIGTTSKSNVHRILHDLAARDFIRIEPGRPRGIEVLG